MSKDKTPYKTHMGIWMWQGEGAKFESSGCYLRLEPPHIMPGVGLLTFSKTFLKAYRDAVAGPELVNAKSRGVCERWIQLLSATQ